MASIKPLKLYGKGGPNPVKVQVVLKELDVPYEIEAVEFADVKKPAYLAVNPNGRLPSLYDPNTDVTIWESGAIIEYVMTKYDPTHRLSFADDTPEFWHGRQWLYFQATGQGPYFGQMVWFTKFHSETLPSARERYIKEVVRVTEVLEAQLKREASAHPNAAEGPWLVGGKLSYVDLSFIPWQRIARIIEKDQYDEAKFPHVHAWMERMEARKATAEALKSLGM